MRPVPELGQVTHDILGPLPLGGETEHCRTSASAWLLSEVSWEDHGSPLRQRSRPWGAGLLDLLDLGQDPQKPGAPPCRTRHSPPPPAWL